MSKFEVAFHVAFKIQERRNSHKSRLSPGAISLISRPIGFGRGVRVCACAAAGAGGMTGGWLPTGVAPHSFYGLSAVPHVAHTAAHARSAKVANVCHEARVIVAHRPQVSGP